MSKQPANRDSTNRTCDIPAQDKQAREQLCRELGRAREALPGPVYCGRPPLRAQIPASYLSKRD